MPSTVPETQLGKAVLNREKPDDMFVELFPKLPDTFFLCTHFIQLRVLMIMVNYLQKGIEKLFGARNLIEIMHSLCLIFERQHVLFCLEGSHQGCPGGAHSPHPFLR